MMDNTHGNNAGGGGPGPGGPGSGSGGAQHLARIHGTEEDRVNCPFYFKIGACRHGDRCSRTHHKPAFSPTVLLRHVYQHPVRVAELKAAERSLLGGGGATAGETKIDRAQAVEDFLQFYENMYEELGKFGRLEALHVCDNLGDHMIGHVYAKFASEEEAADALQIMNGRYYDGRQMEVEFSPVTDFREARCRDFDEDTCARGGFCNFMHIKPVPHCLVRSLEQDCEFERRREEMERQRQRERDRRGRGGRRRRRGGGSDVSDSSDGDDSGDSDDGNKRGRQRPGRSRSGSRGRGGGGGGRVGRKRSRRSDSRSASRSRSRSGSRK